MSDLTYTEARERLVALVEAARSGADARPCGCAGARRGTCAMCKLRSTAADCADLDALVAALRLPDSEYVCTRCGLREQRGEAPKGDF